MEEQYDKALAIIADHVINGTVHQHYDHMVERANWCEMMFTGKGQSKIVENLRPSEEKEQKEFRVRVSYPETPEVLSGIKTICQRFHRVDGVTETINHTDESRKTEITDAVKMFSPLGGPTDYLKARQLYYEFVDPNAWLIIDRWDERTGDNVDAIYTNPIEISSHDAVNYKMGPSAPVWLLARYYLTPQKREFRWYAAGITVVARELDDDDPVMEFEDVRDIGDYRFAFSQYLNSTKTFPGAKFGAYQDDSVNDITVKAPIYASAGNALKRIVRNSSLASVQLVTHVYQRMLAYDEPCSYEDKWGRGCGDIDGGGKSSSCPACGGTGSSLHRSTMDVTRVQLPDYDEENPKVISLQELVYYVPVPLEPTKLLLEEVKNDKRYVPFSVFNSQTVDQPVVTTTATEQRFNWENANNRIDPLPTHNAHLHWVIYRATAEHLDYDAGFEYGYNYPKALDVEPEDSIIARYGTARSNGLPGMVINSIGEELIIKRIGSDKIKARNFAALQVYRPLASFDTTAALSILMSRDPMDKDRILFENWDKVWCIIINEYPGFFSMDYDRQKETLDSITVDIAEGITMPGEAELPLLDLTAPIEDEELTENAA